MRRLWPVCALLACGGQPEELVGHDRHGLEASGVSAPMGEPAPYATAEQLETFERGRDVSLHRFSREEGLGPAFNVTFCGSCHEKPVTGGSGGLYRNFFLTGRTTPDGAFFVPEDPVSANGAGGVVRMYYFGEDVTARPPIPEDTNVVAQRNPVPFFGVGLLAEIDEQEILKRADPNDLNADGISGRPNYDRGFVGRFGRKAQTVSIEGFIRGPLFNHLGITTDPLTDAQRGLLPVDSRATARQAPQRVLQAVLKDWLQAAAPDGPLTDEDDAPDPEMSTDELFDLVTFSMLLAAPELEPLTPLGEQGLEVFDHLGCNGCHTPRLEGPRGPLPVYSDLLLHDMGDQLADGLVQGEATGNEFRTQPLWGLSATGPYLHDGRALTLTEAVDAHGGEAELARLRWEHTSVEDRLALLEFLMSLGGRSQFTAGLIPPGEPVAAVGDWGGPTHALSASEEATFLAGRELFDLEFGVADGVGGPRLNGDSCRACHFEPVVGGAGPRGVNVMRHGVLAGDDFAVPAIGTILHKTTILRDTLNEPQAEAQIFEHRQTPHLFGLGLVESISEADILALADPDDLDGDGISGRASWTDGGRLGRFGWKGQVPSIEEFVRDAVTAELGMTLPWVDGLTFGKVHDNDDVLDPEFSLEQAQLLEDYLRALAPPPRGEAQDPALVASGEALFETVGCALCHVPSLPSPAGPVPLFSDLLLHRILPDEALGIEDASADMWEFRTPPLWGVRATGPWLHSGEADTLEDAIHGHDGEAVAVRDAYQNLSTEDQAALIAFLETL